MMAHAVSVPLCVSFSRSLLPSPAPSTLHSRPTLPAKGGSHSLRPSHGLAGCLAVRGRPAGGRQAGRDSAAWLLKVLSMRPGSSLAAVVAACGFAARYQHSDGSTATMTAPCGDVAINGGGADNSASSTGEEPLSNGGLATTATARHCGKRKKQQHRDGDIAIMTASYHNAAINGDSAKAPSRLSLPFCLSLFTGLCPPLAVLWLVHICLWEGRRVSVRSIGTELGAVLSEPMSLATSIVKNR